MMLLVSDYSYHARSEELYGDTCTPRVGVHLHFFEAFFSQLSRSIPRPKLPSRKGESAIRLTIPWLS